MAKSLNINTQNTAGQNTSVQNNPGFAERFLDIDHVSMSFVTAKAVFHALENVSIRIRQGEFVSIIGHSGCGKSTVLNLVAGLLTPTTGAVLLKDREINCPGPERAVVFQNHSLLPWLTVFGNVYLAVERVFGGKESKLELAARANRVIQLVGLAPATLKYPHELSGGMKQRVGIARALAMEPQVLLLDEPFGALDALTRTHLQDELMRITAGSGNTVLMVTHDVDEAVLLSDRIVMMTNGPGATVGEILDVDLPRPRQRMALVEDPHYMHLRGEVLRFLYQRHALHAA